MAFAGKRASTGGRIEKQNGTRRVSHAGLGLLGRCPISVRSGPGRADGNGVGCLVRRTKGHRAGPSVFFFRTRVAAARDAAVFTTVYTLRAPTREPNEQNARYGNNVRRRARVR